MTKILLIRKTGKFQLENQGSRAFYIASQLKNGGHNMDGRMVGFIMWAIFGCILIVIGSYFYFSKKEATFWANIKNIPVKDRKGYNHAVGKLLIGYGVIFIILGLPLLLIAKNSSYILLSVVAVMLETIGTMIIYSLMIEKKYRKQ